MFTTIGVEVGRFRITLGWLIATAIEQGAGGRMSEWLRNLSCRDDVIRPFFVLQMMLQKSGPNVQ